MSFFKHLRKKTKKNNGSAKPKESPFISVNVEKNYQYIKDLLGNTPDLIYRKLQVGNSSLNAIIIGLQLMIDKDLIHDGILKPIMENSHLEIRNLEDVGEKLIQTLDLNYINNMDDVIYYLLDGNIIFFLEDSKKALVINLRKVETRAIDDAKSEASVRGPHEGLTESLGINITMIRRRINNSKLRFELVTVGNDTKTKVCIVYIEDIANNDVVNEVRNRIKAISTDAIIESGYIEQFIEDYPYSVFPTVGNTEKVDRLSAKMLEGRVGILVDGSTISLTVPYFFIEGFQTSEDYYSLPFYTSLLRIIRYISFFLSINLPAFYIAIQNFQEEMIPTEMIITLTSARQGVPFPVTMETLLFLLIFEILREAGIRMPKNVGQAVSIVGAIVIGEAAVTAGIAAAPTVIVVATVGITTFIVTPFTSSVGLMRLIMIIPASVIGLYGLLLAHLALLAHLSSLKSFGYPYLSPMAPLIFKDWRDLFWRSPINKMDSAPKSILQSKDFKDTNSLAKQNSKIKRKPKLFWRNKR